MDVIFRFCMAHIYNNHNVIETVNNCMPVGSFQYFMVWWIRMFLIETSG